MYKNSEISNKADHETRQRLIGGYKKSCENLLEFSTRNPEDKNSQNYKQLVSLKERALDKLYSYQPALRKLYPDKNDFPIFDGDNIRMVDIGNILIDAMKISYEDPDFADNKTQSINLDSLFTPVTVSNYKKDANGDLVGDDDGHAILEDVTIFTIKGANLEEVKNNFQAVLNTVVNNSEATISSLKKEIEDITNLIPELDGTNDYYTNNANISLERFFGKTTEELSSSNFESEILRIMQQPKGQETQKKTLSLIRYSEKLNKFIDTVIDENMKQSGNYFRNFLNDTSVNTISDNKLVKTTGRNALSNYLFDTVASKLQTDYENALLTKNQSDLALFNNPFGENDLANERFNNILSVSLDTTMRRLSNDNSRIPNDVFQQAVRPNLEAPQRQSSLPEMFSNPENYGDYLSNPNQAVDKMLGRQEAPQLDYYGQPVVRDVYYQTPAQAQLEGQGEMNLDNITKDIIYERPAETKPVALQLDLSNFKSSNF